MPDFSDEDQLKEWLKDKPQEVSVAIAARSALRVLPFAGALVDQKTERVDGPLFFLSCARATLTSSVACKYPTEDVRRAAASSSAAASSAASAVASSAVAVAASSASVASSAVAVAVASSTSAVAAFSSAFPAASAVASSASAVASASVASSAALSSDANHWAVTQSAVLLFNAPLWPETSGFPDLLTATNQFLNFAAEHAEIWGFWARWYQSMWDGTPMDWELQRRVALIDDAVWKVGPEAVAGEIARIEREMAGPSPLEEKTLLRHVQYLLKNPVLSHATAINGAVTIERAIADYMREAPANCLPDGLAHLEELPMHFRAIAKVLTISTPVETNERDLLVQIQGLHARVSELEKELAVAKSKTLKGVISENAAKKFGETIGGFPFWAAVAGNAMFFFGVEPNDLTLENFRGFASELLKQNIETPAPVGQSLPLSTDV